MGISLERPIFWTEFSLDHAVNWEAISAIGQIQRKHRDAIFASFGVAHRDLAQSEINVLYPQPDALH